MHALRRRPFQESKGRRRQSIFFRGDGQERVGKGPRRRTPAAGAIHITNRERTEANAATGIEPAGAFIAVFPVRSGAAAQIRAKKLAVEYLQVSVPLPDTAVVEAQITVRVAAEQKAGGIVALDEAVPGAVKLDVQAHGIASAAGFSEYC